MQLGENPESWRGLCSIYPLLEMVPEYLECLTRWAKMDKGAATPWVLLAVEHERQGRHDDAQEAWRKAFELRGYVKIRCPACGTEDRRPYLDSKGFDPFLDVVCVNCGEKVKMPEGLAVD